MAMAAEQITAHPYQQGFYGSNSCRSGWDAQRRGGCGQKAENHASRERCDHAGTSQHPCIDYYKDGCQHCIGGCYCWHNRS